MKSCVRSIVGAAAAALVLSLGCGGDNEATFEQSIGGAPPSTVPADAPRGYDQYEQQDSGYTPDAYPGQ